MDFSKSTDHFSFAEFGYEKNSIKSSFVLCSLVPLPFDKTNLRVGLMVDNGFTELVIASATAQFSANEAKWPHDDDVVVNAHSEN